VIQIEHLNFSYGKEPLFQDLNLSLEPGAIYGLLGRNGAGKTTLLRIVCGQLYAQGGTTSVLGEPPESRLPRMLSDIYFLPEEFYLPAVTAARYRAMFGPFYPRFDDTLFAGYLGEFELNPRKQLSAYSYGQKKKFLLAFGLASGCSLLLLDEPTNGLDIPSKSQFRRVVAAAIGEQQTFLISTHQARDMEHLIDPIIIVEGGRIVLNKGMEEIDRKLEIRQQRNAPNPGDALYAERTVGGYALVVERTNGGETGIDLELLFNAVVAPDSPARRLLEGGITS
jgi:ABC-2 type transport system ATP-binding protein